MYMNLSINMLIEWLSNDATSLVERLLWMDASAEDIVTIDINLKNVRALPIWRKREEIEAGQASGCIRILDADPFSILQRPEQEILEKHRKLREDAWAAIESLVIDEATGQLDKAGKIFDPSIRGPLIAAYGKRKRLIYKHLRRFWQGGQTKNALLPYFFNCGGQGKEREKYESKPGRQDPLAPVSEKPTGVVIDATKRAYLRRGIKVFYLSGKEKTLTGAYHRTMETFFNRGYCLQGNILVPVLPPAEELPSPRQFTYQYYQYLRNPTQLLTSRNGERGFNLRHRAILGSSIHMAHGPGFLVQGDATIADISLVSKKDRSRIIGRPVIYVIIDVVSRLIVGLGVSLEGPSWLGMMLALENMAMDKVTFCREYGVEITEDEWPSHHLPEAILGDRGELEGYNADNLVNAFNIRIHNTAPYRCDWKGIVEQNFRLINNEVIHWSPGAVYHPRERGQKDYRLDACLDLDQFRQLMILCVLRHNNNHRMKWYRFDEFAIADHVEPYPIDLWRWGIQNRSGHLQTRDLNVVRSNLLPSGVASVTEQGIIFKGVSYTCELAIREQWFVRARHWGRWKVPVVIDPRKTDVIYLKREYGQKLDPCIMLDRDKPTYAGRDWQDIEDYLELQKQAEQAARTRELRTEAEFHAQAEQVMREAEEMTKEAVQGLSNRTRTKNIHENWREERDDERLEKAWPLAPQQSSKQGEVLIEPEAKDQPKPSTKGYIPPDQPIDDIRKQREKKLLNSRKESTNGQ
jgi:putative transposase